MTTVTPNTQLNTQWVTVNTPDGPMEAYLAQPADTRLTAPAVLVLMEIFGVNSHICSVTDRLAKQGYVALAPNYYHRSTQNLDLPYNDQGMMEGRRHKDLTSRETLLADGASCLQYLDTLPSVKPGAMVGAMGFCFGGNVAYTLATQPRVSTAVCFYPGGVGELNHPQAPVHRTADIKGHVLLCFGEKDALIPADHRLATEAALQQHGISHEVVVFPGVGHGFFCDARADYNAQAAEQAWQLAIATLGNNLQH